MKLITNHQPWSADRNAWTFSQWNALKFPQRILQFSCYLNRFRYSHSLTQSNTQTHTQTTKHVKPHTNLRRNGLIFVFKCYSNCNN